MSDLLELFRAEASEYLQLLNDSLLELERAGDAEEARHHLDEMFRAAHSLKGMSATMGYQALARFTHRMEDLLDRLRHGEMTMTPAVADLLFEGLDHLERMLSRPEDATVDEELMERYTQALEAGSVGAPGGMPEAAEDELPPADHLGGLQPTYRFWVQMKADAPMKSVRGHIVLRALEEAEDAVAVTAYRPDPLTDPDEAFDEGMEVIVRTDLPPASIAQRLEGIPDVERVEYTLLDAGTGLPAEGAPQPATPGTGPGETTTPAAAEGEVAAPQDEAAVPQGEAAVPQGEGAADQPPAGPQRSVPERRPAAAPAAGQKPGAAPKAGNGRPAAGPGSAALAPDRIVRVDTEQLDALVNLVGELVIYRSRLQEVTSEAQHHNGALAETVEHIDRITDNLQHAVMALRMVPVNQVFSRFPRVVRDICRKLGKDVEFITEGEETELDRSIVHQLGDPLVHLIRNALDHGIESPEERRRAGKPERGLLRLSARHQGNHVLIEVSDDGRGIDPDRIAEVALERGIIEPEELEALTPSQKLQLIFRPGFSTAKEVTDVSGRGVGMDAVRTAMESLNGQVEMTSEKGVGTSVTLRLPLTLAIIPALFVRCGTEMYALPLEYVVQNLRLDPRHVHTIQGIPHLRWREHILAVRSLADLMKLPPERRTQTKQNGAGRPAVVIDVGPRQAVLEVDEIVGQQEVVIKNLGSVVGEIRGVAGATVLGDGRVALIVDLPAVLA